MTVKCSNLALFVALHVHCGVRARRRLLVPYSFGGAHLALSNLLCLLGAVLGGAGAWALKRYGTDLFHSDKGAPDWLVGPPPPPPQKP